MATEEIIPIKKKEKVKLWLKEEIFLNQFTAKDYYRKEANLIVSRING